MSIVDTVLKMVTKQPKEAPTGSRSEREAKIKDKAGLVINIFALLLAVNTFIGNGLSSTVMNNTIKANDLWNFYQAKSIKQSLAELGLEQAIFRGDVVSAEKYQEKIARYESDPTTGDGKKEIMEKAKKLESERDAAKKRSPWISFASTAYQLSIVLLSASILAVNMYLFWGSFVVAGAGLLLMSQGIWMWL